MKKLCLFTFAIFHLSYLAFAQRPNQEQQVIQLSKRKFEWLVTKNIDSLKMILDDQAKYVHSNGWIQTKQEVLEDVVSGKLDYRKVTVSEANVRVYPGLAILLGKGKFSGIVNANLFSIELLYTEVYVKKGEKWLLTSRHANRMQDFLGLSMEQKNNPLHGKTLEMILQHLVDLYGWKDLGIIIKINCFNYDPSIKSSLTFLRKTPWARKKVEDLYIDSLR